MWLGRQPAAVTPQAEAWARAFFAGCAVHVEEATAVYVTLTGLHPGPVQAADPDVPLAQLAPGLTRHFDTSLDGIERRMAIEVALGASDLAKAALAELAAESVTKLLLGSTWLRSSWDPRTIWLRSLRGIVNERVRHRGGCSCGDPPAFRTQA